jgi:hypothetical protein
MKTIILVLYFCLFFTANNKCVAFARFYSVETGSNFSNNLFMGSFQSKNVYNNHYFNQSSIGVVCKNSIKSHYLLSYGYGKYKNFDSSSKFALLVNLINYIQINEKLDFIISLNPSYMKRLSPKSSYSIGVQVPIFQFQDSSFSDTVVTISLNRFVGSGLSHRESSKYVKSIKKKFLWFWVNDK